MEYLSTNICDLSRTPPSHELPSATSSEASNSEKSSLFSSHSSGIPFKAMNQPLPTPDEHVNTVLTQVLWRMDRVVEHLRSSGESDAANAIAQHMVAVIDAFNDSTASWTEEMRFLRLTRAVMTPSTTNSMTNGHHRDQSATSVAAPHNSPSSWAAVAAVAPADNNSIVKWVPPDTAHLSAVIAKVDVNPVDPDLRVLWIREWKENRPLADITKQIGQGPIFSMAYSPKDASVCVIFQYAKSAKALQEDDEQYSKQHGISRFGEGCSTLVGLAFPDTDDLLRMANPHNERRRLTFARQQLFTHGLTEARFKSDIYAVVGPSNVELVWLFNTGNATVVFSAVPLARMVRDEFIRISRQPNSPYRDVHITFSHDPCERPMTLVKQMPAGRDFREGTYGGESALPVGIITKSAPISRRNARDSDGWQTVGRKR